MVYVDNTRNNKVENLSWHQVITLNNYTKSVINPISFNEMGIITENFNLQGLNIISLTLSWAPFFTLTDCKNGHKNCKGKGYLADVMDALGKHMNFTWETDEDPAGNWGTTPISGAANASGVWGGVVGGVTNGEYQLCISSWVNTFARMELVLDFPCHSTSTWSMTPVSIKIRHP